MVIALDVIRNNISIDNSDIKKIQILSERFLGFSHLYSDESDVGSTEKLKVDRTLCASAMLIGTLLKKVASASQVVASEYRFSSNDRTSGTQNGGMALRADQKLARAEFEGIDWASLRFMADVCKAPALRQVVELDGQWSRGTRLLASPQRDLQRSEFEALKRDISENWLLRALMEAALKSRGLDGGGYGRVR